MRLIKLSDYCNENSISYASGYRLFKSGQLPVKAHQNDFTGTIMVEDLSDEKQPLLGGGNVFSILLKKTIECSKNNTSIEDFATWILATFTLIPIISNEAPAYSKNKQKPEMVQNHFKQFLPYGDKPKPTMFVAPPEEFDYVADQLLTANDDVPLRPLHIFRSEESTDEINSTKK